MANTRPSLSYFRKKKLIQKMYLSPPIVPLSSPKNFAVPNTRPSLFIFASSNVPQSPQVVRVRAQRAIVAESSRAPVAGGIGNKKAT
jgi:hypothetical protein